MKSRIKRSSSWPISSVDKTEISEDASQDSTKKQPHSSSSFDENISNRRSTFDSLCSLISEELKYLNKDPDVLKKYGDAVLKKLNEAQSELVKLKELLRKMLAKTPDDNEHFNILFDELQKLKRRVTKLKAKFPSKVKIHLLENEVNKTPEELQRDSLILSMLTEQKLNLPTFYGDSVFEQSEIFGNLYSLFNSLGDNHEKKLCMLCFSVFPKEAKIRRRVMIYWWMAEGFIHKKSDGMSFLETFSTLGFLIPISSKPRSQVHSYKLHPMARIVLIYLARRARLFDFNEKDGTPTEKYISSLQAMLVGQGLSDVKNLEKLHMIFNLNESTLEFNPEWFPRMQNINILLLGRWQSDETHHVEIENPEFLQNLKYLQFLKFLSLQGVSRVTELPNSISKLESLKILDLRACHNLEVIPAGIGGLKNLTHLDMSDCYLIGHMPKEISELENLQVLLGFVVGKPKENRMSTKNSCTLKDLGRLHKLEKLGIYMSVANFATEDLKALQGFESLKTLSISWGSASKDSLTGSGEKAKDKLQRKANHETPKMKSEVHEMKKNDKRVGFTDVADESANSVDQESPRITTEQEAPQASKDGVHKSGGVAEGTSPQIVEDAAETSPGTTQQSGLQTRKDEADKSIGTTDKANTPHINNAANKSIGAIGEESPQAIKDVVDKLTEDTEKETSQANDEQARTQTTKGVTEKSNASIEQASPSKVQDSADAEKPNSETTQQASPKTTKDETDNSNRKTEQISNQEIKKADEATGNIEQANQQIVEDTTEKSTEANEQAITQTTNQQASHQTSKDLIETSTATIEQADPPKEKKEVDDAVKTIEQDKPQTVKDLADAEQSNSGQEVNSANIPENITKRKDQETEKNEEKIEQKTTLLAPVGSFKEENQVESSKVVGNNTSVFDGTKKTNSEMEGEGEGIVEDKKSLSTTPVVAPKQEAEGEISKAMDDNTGISEDSKKKMSREPDGEDNIKDKKASLSPTTTTKQNETNTMKATEDKNQETKQGNNFPVTRTISKTPKSRGLARSETILGAIGNLFQSGEQGPGSQSNDLTLPSSLEKLQLVCYPEVNAPTWLKPESLQSLRKLHISGGKLRDLGDIYDWNDGKPSFTKHTWNVHTLRLKYLSHMEMRWKELQHLFPNLVTLEKVNCPKLTLFPCDGYGMWIDKTKTVR
ncbi:hypothetical protein Leryth_016832 [Lithospermum erythrorhizon]|nr:hypothetical protein Leryth_016832 [Lithospermum erythrorhizon]